MTSTLSTARRIVIGCTGVVVGGTVKHHSATPPFNATAALRLPCLPRRTAAGPGR